MFLQKKRANIYRQEFEIERIKQELQLQLEKHQSKALAEKELQELALQKQKLEVEKSRAELELEYERRKKMEAEELLKKKEEPKKSDALSDLSLAEFMRLFNAQNQLFEKMKEDRSFQRKSVSTSFLEQSPRVPNSSELHLRNKDAPPILGEETTPEPSIGEIPIPLSPPNDFLKASQKKEPTGPKKSKSEYQLFISSELRPRRDSLEMELKQLYPVPTKFTMSVPPVPPHLPLMKLNWPSDRENIRPRNEQRINYPTRVTSENYPILGASLPNPGKKPTIMFNTKYSLPNK